MSSASYSVSELLDLAVDKLPMLRRRVVKARLSSRRYRCTAGRVGFEALR